MATLSEIVRRNRSRLEMFFTDQGALSWNEVRSAYQLAALFVAFLGALLGVAGMVIGTAQGQIPFTFVALHLCLAITGGVMLCNSAWILKAFGGALVILPLSVLSGVIISGHISLSLALVPSALLLLAWGAAQMTSLSDDLLRWSSGVMAVLIVACGLLALEYASFGSAFGVTLTVMSFGALIAAYAAPRNRNDGFLPANAVIDAVLIAMNALALMISLALI